MKKGTRRSRSDKTESGSHRGSDGEETAGIPTESYAAKSSSALPWHNCAPCCFPRGARFASLTFDGRGISI